MTALAASCGKGEDGADTFVVSFLYPDGTWHTQTVFSGERATPPSPPTLQEGLYEGTIQHIGWFLGGAAVPFDFYAPITADTTLQWEPSAAPIHMDSVSGHTTLDKAFAYVNRHPSAYTYIQTAAITLEGELIDKRVLRASNTQLRIFSPYGHSISLSSKGRMFSVGAVALDNTISLTIDGAPLEGSHDNNDILVYMQNGGAFSSNSTISHNASSSGNGIAVYVASGGSFTLNQGGRIENNGNDLSGNPSGLFAADGGTTVRLAGGTIGNNRGWGGGVLVDDSIQSFSLSKEAKVDVLALRATAPNSRTPLTLEADWTGEVEKLHLWGSAYDLADVIHFWETGSPIIIGAGTHVANIGRIGLGEFLTMDADKEAISARYKIDGTGVLVPK